MNQNKMGFYEEYWKFTHKNKLVILGDKRRETVYFPNRLNMSTFLRP